MQLIKFRTNSVHSAKNEAQYAGATKVKDGLAPDLLDGLDQDLLIKNLYTRIYFAATEVFPEFV